MTNLLAYATHLNASEEVMGWLRTTGKKAIETSKATPAQLEHVLDYFVSRAAPQRLQKMSIQDAKRKAKEWSDSNQKKGRNLKDTDKDIETIHDFADGSKIVRLKTKSAYQREGTLMGHCLGGYQVTPGQEIYSYRDKNNLPHATFEVRKDAGEIIQIKGKGNGDIHPKYVHHILAFLQTIGVNIRPSEMQHLGYYHIDKDALATLKTLGDFSNQMIVIHGETYAF